MQKKLLALILFVGLTIFGCSGVFYNGNGHLVVLSCNNRDFSRFDFSHGCRVELQQADTFAVFVTIDDNLRPYVEIGQVDSTLSIGLEDFNTYNPTEFKVSIRCPSVKSCMASGGTSIKINGFSTARNSSVSLSGGSSLEGSWSCGNMNMNLSGGSTVKLYGAGSDLNCDFSGGSVGKLEGFEVSNVKAMLSGGSIAQVYTMGTVNGDLSGGSQLKYNRQAKVQNVSKSGGSRCDAY